MKQIVIMALLVLSGGFCRAQTTEEWFKQKETQRKHMLQQIAAFQAYLGYVQNGYAIAHKGLTTISNIKDGDFNMHQDFISSLKKINPKISRYVKVADIIALQIKIVQTYKHSFRQVRANNFLNEKEINFVLRVLAHLLVDARAGIEALTDVLAAGKLEMKDDERIKRIDDLLSTMQNYYAFAKTISSEVQLLAVQRMKEKHGAQALHVLNGIKIK